ncbi:MAG: bifunctional folylpolyglutamate synthase/dihydrofolate synthase [Solirubrobacterales bacterium]
MTDAHAIEEFLLEREQFGMRFGLERMRRLLAHVGDPQDAVPAVHVVGTNGKSSTTLMTAAALRVQGLRTGAFTSPHLVSFRERIEIDGQMISLDYFRESAARVVAAVEVDDDHAEADDRVTQFEAVAAIAFCAYADAGLDVIVVEAGLGGRLDATNVLGDSRVQVLTGVGIDHTQYLGETLEEIACEKVAVVRSGALLVSGPLPPVVKPVVNAVTDERDANWIELRGVAPAFADLPGEFVRENASLAIVAAESALEKIRPGVWFDARRADQAIHAFAGDETHLGRLQIANTEPFEIRDSAHNPQAAKALTSALSELAEGRPVTLLVAMLADKPVDETLTELLAMVPDDGVVICTAATNPRSLPASELAGRVAAIAAPGVRVEAVEGPIAALGRAREVAGRDGLLSVTGSNYLIADLLRQPGAAGSTL